MKNLIVGFKINKESKWKSKDDFNEKIKEIFSEYKKNGIIKIEELFIKVNSEMGCLYYMEQYTEYEDTFLNIQKEWFLLEGMKRNLINFKDNKFISEKNKYSFDFLSKALNINKGFVNDYLEKSMKNKKVFYEALIEYGFMKENERMSSYKKFEDLLLFTDLIKIIIDKDSNFKNNIEKYYMNKSMSSIYYRNEKDDSKMFFYFLQVKRNSKKSYNYEDMKSLTLINKNILESININIEDIIFKGGEENQYSDLNCLKSLMEMNFNNNKYEDKFHKLKEIMCCNLSDEEIESLKEVFKKKDVLFEKMKIENKLSNIENKNKKKTRRI